MFQSSHEHNRKHLSTGKDSTYRVTIPFATHLFGCGKSAFVKKYLKLLRHFGDRSLEYSSVDPSRKSFLENLKNAAFLYVTLEELEPMIPFEEERNFKRAVHYFLIKTAYTQMRLAEPDPDECFEELKLGSDALHKKIRSLLNIPKEQFLLISFDEVGALEGKTDRFDFDMHPVAGIRPYIEFFGIIRELCKQENLFFIVAGRSRGSSVQNHVCSVSSVVLKLIPLAPLEKENIVEHLEKSSIVAAPNSPKVSDIVCNENCSIIQLEQLVLEFVEGFLVSLAVNMLLQVAKSQPNFSFSKEVCWSIMNYPNAPEHCVAPFLPRFVSLSARKRRVMEMLLLFSLYRIRFRSHEEMNVGSNHTVPLLDYVSDMFEEKNGNTSYEVWIPKLLVKYMEGQFTSEPLAKLLFKTLFAQPVDLLLESKCRVLGVYCFPIWTRMQLYTSSISTAYYMKSIHHTEARPGRERSTCGNNEWERIVRDKLEFEKKIIFHANLLCIVQICCSSCMERQSSDGIECSEILEEDSTFLQLIYNQILSSHPTVHSFLNIPNTKQTTNVSNDTSHFSRCYFSGDRIGDFVAPDSYELVILSKRFLCKYIFASLKGRYKSTGNSHWEDAGISNICVIC
eukprot:jgi/Galph1/2023/GphlegSOOS_G726.1